MNNEIYHYGVKGMKWGKRQARLENRAIRKFARVGKKLGEADYERSKGAEEYKKHDDAAKVFDKTARKMESQGNYFRAEAARKAAAALRTRGENLKRSRDEGAAYLEKRAAKMQEKATKFATKKNVDLGKKKINSILGENKQKGFESRKNTEEFFNEVEARQKLGDRGYNAYNYIRGK